MAAEIRIARIGFKAHAALAAAGHRARVLATLSESIYLTAGDEIVWLGGADTALHGRALLTPSPGGTHDAKPPDVRGDTVSFDVAAAQRWQPPTPPRAAAAAEGCRALSAAIGTVGAPEGFGALLVGRTPPFPLDRASGGAAVLARACCAGDAEAATAAARELVGLGPGLTPAGDDFVGGAFFARAVLGSDATGDWERAARAVIARARTHTHAISATLLADLCAGHGHAPLHELACALAAGRPLVDALEAARRLVRIGHSSGWDILAGFLGALAGLPRGC